MAKGISSNLFSNNFYDPSFEKSLANFRKVQKFKNEHPDAKKADAIRDKALGLSKNTISKYWEPENEPSPNNQIFSSVETLAAISKVADEDKDILNIILRVYLPGEERFDCDLTFGKGGFYKGISYPNHCYDEYPSQSSGSDGPPVFSLNEIDNKGNKKAFIPDNSLSSIVIDLPQEISKSGKGNVGAFKSMTHLAETYNKMLEIAQRKLRFASSAYPGGILVVKVGDIIHKGETIWLSQIVAELAVGMYSSLSEKFLSKIKKLNEVSLEFIDKFVHRYKPEEIDTTIVADRSIKAHDYYLVFRKGGEDRLYYFISNQEDGETSLHNDVMSYNGDIPVVDNRDYELRRIRKNNPGSSLYEVKISDLKPSTTLSLYRSAQYFKDSANSMLDDWRKKYPELPIVFPRYAFQDGEKLIKYIKYSIAEKIVSYDFREKKTIEFLTKMGIKYISLERLSGSPKLAIIKADSVSVIKITDRSE